VTLALLHSDSGADKVDALTNGSDLIASVLQSSGFGAKPRLSANELWMPPHGEAPFQMSLNMKRALMVDNVELYLLGQVPKDIHVIVDDAQIGFDQSSWQLRHVPTVVEPSMDVVCNALVLPLANRVGENILRSGVSSLLIVITPSTPAPTFRLGGQQSVPFACAAIRVNGGDPPSDADDDDDDGSGGENGRERAERKRLERVRAVYPVHGAQAVAWRSSASERAPRVLVYGRWRGGGSGSSGNDNVASMLAWLPLDAVRTMQSRGLALLDKRSRHVLASLDAQRCLSDDDDDDDKSNSDKDQGELAVHVDMLLGYCARMPVAALRSPLAVPMIRALGQYVDDYGERAAKLLGSSPVLGALVELAIAPAAAVDNDDGVSANIALAIVARLARGTRTMASRIAYILFSLGADKLATDDDDAGDDEPSEYSQRACNLFSAAIESAAQLPDVVRSAMASGETLAGIVASAIDSTTGWNGVMLAFVALANVPFETHTASALSTASATFLRAVADFAERHLRKDQESADASSSANADAKAQLAFAGVPGKLLRVRMLPSKSASVTGKLSSAMRNKAFDIVDEHVDDSNVKWLFVQREAIAGWVIAKHEDRDMFVPLATQEQSDIADSPSKEAAAAASVSSTTSKNARRKVKAKRRRTGSPVRGSDNALSLGGGTLFGQAASQQASTSAVPTQTPSLASQPVPSFPFSTAQQQASAGFSVGGNEIQQAQTYSFSRAQESTSTGFSFGNASQPRPSFSFGSSQAPTSTVKPTFSFGAGAATPPMPPPPPPPTQTFSFGSGASEPSPSLSFGNTATATPSFSFGNGATATLDAPSSMTLPCASLIFGRFCFELAFAIDEWMCADDGDDKKAALFELCSACLRTLARDELAELATFFERNCALPHANLALFAAAEHSVKARLGNADCFDEFERAERYLHARVAKLRALPIDDALRSRIAKAGRSHVLAPVVKFALSPPRADLHEALCAYTSAVGTERMLEPDALRTRKLFRLFVETLQEESQDAQQRQRQLERVAFGGDDDDATTTTPAENNALDVLAELWDAVLGESMQACVAASIGEAMRAGTPTAFVQRVDSERSRYVRAARSGLFAGVAPRCVQRAQDAFVDAFSRLQFHQQVDVSRMLVLYLDELLDTVSSSSSRSPFTRRTQAATSALDSAAWHFAKQVASSEAFRHLYELHASKRMLRHRHVTVEHERVALDRLDTSREFVRLRRMLADFAASHRLSEAFEAHTLQVHDDLVACNAIDDDGDDERKPRAAIAAGKGKSKSKQTLASAPSPSTERGADVSTRADALLTPLAPSRELASLLLGGHFSVTLVARDSCSLGDIDGDSAPLRFPGIAGDIVRSFERFYAAQYDDRELRWLPQMGSALVSWSSGTAAIDIVMTTLQLCVALQLRECDDPMSLAELSKLLGVGAAHLNAALLSLSAARHPLLLASAAPSDAGRFGASAKFAFNARFEPEPAAVTGGDGEPDRVHLRSVRAHAGGDGDDDRQNLKRLFAWRRWLLDAAIVREVKGLDAPIEHAALRDAVIARCRGQFHVPVELADARIGAMCANGYLTVSTDSQHAAGGESNRNGDDAAGKATRCYTYVVELAVPPTLCERLDRMFAATAADDDVRIEDVGALLDHVRASAFEERAIKAPSSNAQLRDIVELLDSHIGALVRDDFLTLPLGDEQKSASLAAAQSAADARARALNAARERALSAQIEAAMSAQNPFAADTFASLPDDFASASADFAVADDDESLFGVPYYSEPIANKDEQQEKDGDDDEVAGSDWSVWMLTPWLAPFQELLANDEQVKQALGGVLATVRSSARSNDDFAHEFGVTVGESSAVTVADLVGFDSTSNRVDVFGRSVAGADTKQKTARALELSQALARVMLGDDMTLADASPLDVDTLVCTLLLHGLSTPVGADASIGGGDASTRVSTLASLFVRQLWANVKANTELLSVVDPSSSSSWSSPSSSSSSSSSSSFGNTFGQASSSSSFGQTTVGGGQASSSSAFSASDNIGAIEPVPYQATTDGPIRLHSISAQPAYSAYSQEELRWHHVKRERDLTDVPSESEVNYSPSSSSSDGGSTNDIGEQERTDAKLLLGALVDEHVEMADAFFALLDHNNDGALCAQDWRHWQPSATTDVAAEPQSAAADDAAAAATSAEGGDDLTSSSDSIAGPIVDRLWRKLSDQSLSTSSPSPPPTAGAESAAPKPKKKGRSALLYSSDALRSSLVGAAATAVMHTPAVETMELATVATRVWDACNSVAEALNIEHGQAQHVLLNNGWRAQQAIDSALDDDKWLAEQGVAADRRPQVHAEMLDGGADGRRVEASSSTAAASPAELDDGVRVCPCCWDDFEDARRAVDMFALDCGHWWCRECYRKHASVVIAENRAHELRCPEQKCTLALTSEALELLLGGDGGDTATLDAYKRAVSRLYVRDEPTLCWCKNPDGCGGIMVVGDTDVLQSGRVSCSLCKFDFCPNPRCSFPAHAPTSCDMLLDWQKRGGYIDMPDTELDALKLKLATSKPCPNPSGQCNARVEKNSGCKYVGKRKKIVVSKQAGNQLTSLFLRHITCLHCKYEYCWICLRKWPSRCTCTLNDERDFSKHASIVIDAEPMRFNTANRKCLHFAHASEVADEFVRRARQSLATAQSAELCTILNTVRDCASLLGTCHRALLYASIYRFFCTHSDANTEDTPTPASSDASSSSAASSLLFTPVPVPVAAAPATTFRFGAAPIVQQPSSAAAPTDGSPGGSLSATPEINLFDFHFKTLLNSTDSVQGLLEQWFEDERSSIFPRTKFSQAITSLQRAFNNFLDVIN
jgi:Cullin family/IBR domain, a half RING-finger domain